MAGGSRGFCDGPGMRVGVSRARLGRRVRLGRAWVLASRCRTCQLLPEKGREEAHLPEHQLCTGDPLLCTPGTGRTGDTSSRDKGPDPALPAPRQQGKVHRLLLGPVPSTTEMPGHQLDMAGPGR